MTKKEIIKRTVYEFKKFARQHKFWEEYKRLSVRLGSRKEPYIHRDYNQVTFIQLVGEVEPVSLIQGSSVFCSWPKSITEHGEHWIELSKQWAYFCLTNGLFYEEEKALRFVEIFISGDLKYRYLREKKELQLEFK
jgi:hypothetical protein